MWLCAKPGTGKSRLASKLSEYCRTFFVCLDEEWWDNYDDDYELIIFDEFKGQKKIQMMNRFISGERCSLKQRGVAPFVKMSNPPVVILSNYTVEGCYSKTDVDDPGLIGLKDRVVEVVFNENFELKLE